MRRVRPNDLVVREDAGLGGGLQALPERHVAAVAGGVAGDAIERGAADARQRRQVEEARERCVVVGRVGSDLQAAEHVEDLGALVEALAAGQSVGDAGVLEGGFERT